MSPPRVTFLRLISPRVARSPPTKPSASTIQHMISRGVQMSSTFVHDLMSWLLLLMMTTPTPISMAGSLTSSLFPYTTRVQSKLWAIGGRRFKSSGYGGLNRTLTTRMDSLAFVFHDYSLLHLMVWPSGIVSSHHPGSCVLPISSLPSIGTLWIPNPVLRVLMQSDS